jgi:hypothetical protein
MFNNPEEEGGTSPARFTDYAKCSVPTCSDPEFDLDREGEQHGQYYFCGHCCHSHSVCPCEGSDGCEGIKAMDAEYCPTCAKAIADEDAALSLPRCKDCGCELDASELDGLQCEKCWENRTPLARFDAVVNVLKSVYTNK